MFLKPSNPAPLNKPGLLSTIRLNQTTLLAQQDTVVKSFTLLPPIKPDLLAAALRAAAALRSAWYSLASLGFVSMRFNPAFINFN
jgi:hypothetical protein